MSNGLGNITNRSIRDTLGDRAMNAGLLAIHGTNTENVLTTAAVKHTINGVFQTDFAIDPEIDISALAVISAKDGSVLSAATAASATVTHAARASGDDDETLTYILACKGNTAYVIEPTIDVAAAQDDADYSLTCPPGYAAFGLIKLVRASTDTAAFQLGNNTAATGDLDATGRTATFFDVSAVPPTVASIVEN